MRWLQWRGILLRLALAAFTLLLLSALVFGVLSLATGDAATVRIGAEGSVEQVAALRHQLGLDLPLWQRYCHWLAAALRGDLGHSAISGEAVSHILLTRGVSSLQLGMVTVALLIPLSLLLGLFCGLRAGSVGDRLMALFTLTLLGIPEFVTGTLLVLLFAFTLHWLPALSLVSAETSGVEWLKAVALPVLTLLSVCLAQNVRLIRAGVMTAAQSEACRTARMNGFSEWRVVTGWILPVAMINFLPLLARYITALLSGALIAETLFAWPGLASTLLNATQNRDTPLVMGISCAICLLTVTLNALADIITALLSPAVREHQ